MKRRILLILSCLIIFLVSVIIIIYQKNEIRIEKISLESDYNDLFTREELELNGHIKVLPEYSDDSSIAFLNNDGSKTLYIYSSPIRYFDSNGELTLMDTRLSNIDDENLIEDDYVYSVLKNDIVPLYPSYISNDKGIRLVANTEYEIGFYTDKKISNKVDKFNNFIHERKNMVYYNIDNLTAYFYPSNIGSNCELKFNNKPETNTYNLWLKLEDASFGLRKEPGGYLIIIKKSAMNSKSPDDILGIIQEPILKSSSGEVSYKSTIDYEIIDDITYKLKITLDDEYLGKDSNAFVSFEMRQNKQPDNAVYSKLPDIEYAYLKNYSVIGNSNKFGIGRLFVRYSFLYPLGLNPNDIKMAKYSTYSMTEYDDTIEMMEILERWCSLTGNWNNAYSLGQRVSLVNKVCGEIQFDITEEVIRWLNDSEGILEQNGLAMKSVEEKEGIYNLFLTNDNSLYRCRTEIMLK